MYRQSDPLLIDPLDVIREQCHGLDPDEQKMLRRILGQVERLDAALADLHLFLTRIEFCFYGIRSESNTGYSLSARSLRKLIKVQGTEACEFDKSFSSARPIRRSSVPDSQRNN